MIVSTNPPPTGSKIKPQLVRRAGDIPIIHMIGNAYCQFSLLLIKFPKSQRYTLGQTCSTYLLHILEHTLGAAGSPQKEIKKKYLENASIQLDALKLLIRLSNDCKCISYTGYLDMETNLHQIGKMLGGWIRSLA